MRRREELRMRVRGDGLESICRIRRPLRGPGHRSPVAFGQYFEAPVYLRPTNGRRLRRHEGNSALSFRLERFRADREDTADRAFPARIRPAFADRAGLYPEAVL